MTIPINPGEVPENPAIPGDYDDTGTVFGAGFSALNSRTQENITGAIQSQLVSSNVWDGLWDAFWGIVSIPGNLLLDVLEKLFPGLDWDGIRSFNLFETINDLVTNLVAALREVPFLGDLIDWITGAVDGTAETLGLWFDNLRSFTGNINLLSPNFDLLAAAEDFIDFILFPVGKVADMVGLDAVADGLRDAWDAILELPIISDIVEWLTGAANGTSATLIQWFANLRDFLGNINFFSPNFDLLAAAENFIDFILFPVGKIADMLSLNAIGEALGDLVSNLLQFPATVLGSIGNVIIDGIKSVGDFLSGLWGAFTGQPGGNKTVDEVVVEASAVSSLASLADQAAIVNGENLQTTWNEIFDGLNGTTGSVNKTPADVRNRGAAVRQKAIDADANAGLAQQKANDARELAKAKIASGANIATDPGFEQGGLYVGINATRSDEAARGGTYSAKVVAPGNNYSFIYPVALEDTQVVVPVSGGDIFYVEFYVKGLSTNDSVSSNVWFQTSNFRFGETTNNSAVAHTAVNTLHDDGWHLISGMVTMPDKAHSASFYIVFGNNIPLDNVYFVDDVRLVRITEAQAAQLEAEGAASAAGTAASAADTAQGAAELAQTAAEDAAGAADEADIKAVAAQSALNEVAKSGSNIAANPGCESTVFMLSSNATEYSTALKRSGARSIKMTGITGQNIDVQFFKSVVAPIITLPVTGGDVLYFEAWIRGGSGNTKVGGAIRPYLLSGDPASPTMSYPANIATYTGTLTDLNAGWQKLSGFFLVPAGAVGLQCVVQLHTGSGTGCVLHVDDLVCYRITEAYNAQLEAEGALGAAGTAQTAADAAQGAAATADAKAVTAQAAADAATALLNAKVLGGSSVTTNQTFSDTSQALGSAGYFEYSTEQVYVGTNSAKFTSNAVYVALYGTANAAGILAVPCTPGQVYYMEAMVRGHASNVQSLSTGITLVAYFDGGPSAIIAREVGPTQVGTGVWYKLSGYVTIPAGAVGFKPRIDFRQTLTAGERYYIDNFRAVDVTDAYNAKVAAETAQGAAEAADDKAVVAKSLANSALRAGPNLATNPSFENSNLAIRKSLSNYSTDQARTGIQSFKTAGYTYSYMFSDENGWITLPCTPGDTYAVEIWVYGHEDNATITGGYATAHFQTYNTAGALLNTTYIGGLYLSAAAANAAKGVWTKLAGTITIPANAASFQVTAAISNFTPSNVTFYWDDFACYRITEAQAAQLEAEAAAGAAGTAQTAAETAQGAAATADGKAVVAQAVAATALTTGANLATNPGFENTNLYINYSATHRRYSTEQAHSGATSFKMSNYTWVELFSDTTQYVRLPCSPGDRFYAEIWVLGHASNAATTRDAYLQAGSWDVDGNVVNGAINVTGWTDANFPQWTKLSGEFTVGANAATFMVSAVQLSGSGDGSGNTYYWDDFKCYRITEAYYAQIEAEAAAGAAETAQGAAETADGKAVVAQQRLEEWASAGASLSTNPGFEDTSQHLGNGWAYSTEQAYSGTRSAKYVSNGSTYVGLSATATSSNRLGIKVRPDQVFYLEAYVRGHTNNTATGSSGISLVGVFYRNDLTGPYVVTATTVGPTQVGKDNWVKLSGTVIVPADRQLFYPRFDVSGATIPSGNTYYVDWFNTFDITEAYYAQQDADAAQADADLAQATVDSVAASGNLVISPNFEDTAISRIPFTANAGTIEYVTESPYEGSRCLKYTINTPAWSGIYLAPSMNKWRFDVKPGDTYRASIQFKPGASLRTRTTGTAYLYMRFRNASTNADTVAQKGLGATSTGWQEFAATATCPAGYHILEVMFLINGQGLANDFFFLDAASVENVTAAAAINEKLYGAKTATPAQTIITASIPEFDGSKILSGSVSEDRVQNLTANLTLFNANNSAGANLVPDPSFEDAALDAKRKATSGSVASWWTDVTDIVHSGSRAMEVTYASSGAAYPSLQLTPTLTPNWSAPGYDNVRIACRPGQVFYLSQWVYLRPGNTGTREMNLYLATFNAAGTIQYMWVQAFPALETWTKIEGYFKVTRSDVVSVVPLFGAFRPGNSLNAKAIVDDCEMFDVTDSYNRTQTTWDNLYDAFNGTTGSSNRTIDEVRQRGAAVRQKANDADDRVTATNQALYNQDSPLSNILESKLPSNIDGSKIQTGSVASDRIQNLPASKITSGSFTADRIPALAQDKITGLPTELGRINNSVEGVISSGSQLATNAGFETNIFVGTYAERSQEIVRSGSWAAKATSKGDFWSFIYPVCTATHSITVPAKGLTRYYVEYWVYGKETNQAASGNIWFQCTFFKTGQANNTYGTAYISANSTHGSPSDSSNNDANPTWRKASGYIVTDGTTYGVSFYLITDRYLPAGNVYYFDDVIIKEVATEELIANSAVTTDKLANNAVTGPKQALLDASKIVSGQIQPDIIANLPASKVTSGSFAADRIPTLDQSKVSNLSADLTVARSAIAQGQNLIPNPGFEYTDFYMGNNGVYSTAYARQGSRSMLLTGGGNNGYPFNYLIRDRVSQYNLPTQGGRSYLFSVWVYGDPNNVEAYRSGGIRLGLMYTNRAGSYNQYQYQDLPSGTALSGKWTQYSVVLTLPAQLPDVTQVNGDRVIAQMRPFIQLLLVPSTDKYYFDDVEFKDAVNSDIIINNAVTTAKLADNAVTGPKQALLDASKIVSGQIQPDIVANLPQNKVTGLPAGEEAGYEALSQTIARLADELASLKADSEAAELSGQNIKVNFSDYGNVTNLATQTALPAKKWQITNVNGTTYTGATWGTLNGNAQFTGNVSSGSGAPKIIYLGDPAVAGSEKTLTDYQRIRGVLSTPPDGYNLSTGGPAFTAIGRVSDDGNSYVWAKAQFVSQLNLRGSIGCRVNGTEYIWADNIPLGFSLEMTFILGADNNPMKFQVFSGTTLVKEHIDNAKDKNNATIPYSLRGNTTTNYRRWGAITAYSNGLTSGKISSVTATDNLPVDYKGSVARMHRTDTADTGTVSTVDNPLPTNFFAAPLFASQDITASSANGTFKVSNSKMYAVNARIQLASHTAANCRIDLQVSTDNGASWTTVQRGATTWAFDSFHNSQAQDYAVTGNWLQYLNAGDMVRLVTRANTGSKTNFLTGGPDGTTYFTISAV